MKMLISRSLLSPDESQQKPVFATMFLSICKALGIVIKIVARNVFLKLTWNLETLNSIQTNPLLLQIVGQFPLGELNLLTRV